METTRGLMSASGVLSEKGLFSARDTMLFRSATERKLETQKG